MCQGGAGISSAKIMNDFFMILTKTAVFLISYFLVSKYVLKFFKKRNPSAELRDVEIIVVSIFFSVFITSAVKHILKIFI